MKIKLNPKLQYQLECLKPMTWRQRIDHIWSNFKEIILIVLISAILVTGLLYNMLKPSKELLMGGMYINLSLTEEGTEHLQEDLFAHLEGDGKKQEVRLYSRLYGDISMSVEDYDAFNSVVAFVFGEKIDYFLMDQTAMMPLIANECLLDLRQVFSPAQLEQMKDQLQYGQQTDDQGNKIGDPIPIALDVTDMPFVASCVEQNKKIFLAFAINSPNEDSLGQFWDYLMAWQADGQ